ncbi:MAG TPA: fumarylacetoacetate hydrolase family protein [Terriglobales bacterium]|nr:fumarylacetoacetate hydrolase family protein [Terriglobales bacterium]
MILVTFRRPDGHVSIGVVERESQRVCDLQLADAKREAPFGSMLQLIQAGPSGLARASEVVRRTNWQGTAISRLDEVKLLSPVPVPEQIRDFTVTEQHAKQAARGIGRIRSKRLGTPPPPDDIPLPRVIYDQPIYYKGNRFSVIGHDECVRWPRYSKMLDYELEFGIFIGTGGSNIPKSQAHDHIFGFSVFNDFSARDAQEIEMSGPLGPAKGKDFDTGNAIGPWIVTVDEIPDPYDLEMIARVNSEEWSHNNSRVMLHTFEDMIAFVSQDETLYPGEFFGSGTTGNGCGLELDRWLKPGDVVELEVEGIGVLRNQVV